MEELLPEGDDGRRTLSVRLQADELRALQSAAATKGASISVVVREAITELLNPRPAAVQISAGVGTVSGSVTVQLTSNVLVSGWTSAPFRANTQPTPSPTGGK